MWREILQQKIAEVAELLVWAARNNLPIQEELSIVKTKLEAALQTCIESCVEGDDASQSRS